jgi:hypothetical protein
MCDGPASPVPATTFISSYAVTWEKGLGGGTGTLVAASESPAPLTISPLINAPTNCPAGANSVSTAAPGNPRAPDNTFGNLLGADAFCAFSIQLGAYPKHTNGFNTVGPSTDIAAVALKYA